ncbi:unnamed protein product [Ostreobium quekettii]|uniref:asparagine--tRNA ligase n=1 Tax=Ostreobium quekettii TaxID=121088 RepID=A0A8S1JBB8_9CHLO|nr:unnamed protein product [Ostreobium quekettii]|eukprot:evm.model.scf_1295.4 EVM.evm.TU.scf_1295.4   scf_1295:21585-27116(-)
MALAFGTAGSSAQTDRLGTAVVGRLFCRCAGRQHRGDQAPSAPWARCPQWPAAGTSGSRLGLPDLEFVGGAPEARSRLVASSSADQVVTEAGANGAQATVGRTPFTPRPLIKDIKGGADGGLSNVGQTFTVSGWVRTVRSQKSFAFIEVSDGSTLAGLQVVLDPKTTEGYSLVEESQIHTGAAVRAMGELVASPGGKQKVEIQAISLTLLGPCDPGTYPLQKKRHTLEFLRGIAHLRPRTNTIGAVMRVRSALAMATHTFFQSQGFQLLHTPVVSASDCEGAGEMLQVTTMMSTAMRGGSADAKAAANVVKTDQTGPGPSLPVDESGGIDHSEDFFGRPTFLTVSGQLNAEAYACALGRVYTFGPTFRAENSNTSRHLAEFWMIEPEIAFADLDEDISWAEAYVKHCLQHVLETCSEDLELFEKFYQKGLTNRLQRLSSTPFVRITYTEAVDVLAKSEKAFEFPVTWGADLQSEHERYLTEVAYEGIPVFVTNYPKDIKAFYMKLNEDGQTVAAADMLVPGVGELIGGSQREDRVEVLERRMKECGLNCEEYWWYMDLRRYGSVPHAGFGLGFERFVQFVTGMENIRDVIPFPRYPGHCDF